MLRFTNSIAIMLLLVGVAMGAPRKNVLILHEGSRVMPYQILAAGELQKSLTTDKKLNVEIFEEYLDSWRLDPDLAHSAEALEAKYSSRKFDVVVADGARAFHLLLDHPPEFLQDTPVVFFSVEDFQVPKQLPENVTGIVAHVDYSGTIQLARDLQPYLQHIFYIESEPLDDAVKKEALKGEFQSFSNGLDISYWEHDDLGILLKKVTNLPPDSAVLYDEYYEDPSGQTYVPAQVAALIAVSSNVPVYTLYQTIIGSGVVGGVVINFETTVRQAARIILALLHGAKVANFPVEKSQNETMIDWRQFEKFQMSEKRLPPSATVLYREPTIWTRYRWYLLAGGFVIFLQAILLFKLAIEGKKRKESEKSARKLAGRLIHAQEEERRRIAGELHDDVSQRLALVCLQIDTMRGSPPSSQELLVQELSVLYDETDLISSDIHQFSRELHPNILERLGLISALRRYCSEFSLHRKIAVNMQTSGDEPFIHSETALALFRVGQECLMNIAKHSGAASCDVTLNYLHDRVMLEIEDHGKGFDPAEVKEKTGLGIESMRERLRSVGGTLRIESVPMRGTRVRAEAPLVHAAPETTHAELNKTTEVRPNVPAA